VGSKNLGKQIIDAGGKVLEILSDTSANRAQLESWITTYNLNITSLIDAAGMAGAALNVATIRETLFIVKMPEMKIVYVNHGDISGISAPSVDAATTQIVSLLKMP
jgi:hypothetical protein